MTGAWVALAGPCRRGQPVLAAGDCSGVTAKGSVSSDRHSEPERLLTCAEAAKVLGTFETSCYRHRYLTIFRQRSMSTDRQRSVIIAVTRTNPGQYLVCGVSTISAVAPITLRN
jgi:hypothetical protein